MNGSTALKTTAQLKMVKGLSRYISKEDMQMTGGNVKRKKCKKFPPSLIIRKMQISITMKAIPNLLEFLPANGRRGRSVVREVEKTSLLIVDETTHWYIHYGKQCHPLKIYTKNYF